MLVKRVEEFYQSSTWDSSKRISTRDLVKNSSSVGLLLVILTSSINIPVLYLLVIVTIYLQIDISRRFLFTH